MFARVRPSGLFELLSADAWAHALGYPYDGTVILLADELPQRPAKDRG